MRYETGDVLHPAPDLRQAFDLVVEIFTVQVLRQEPRARAIANTAQFVAPGGRLVVIARARDEEDDAGRRADVLLRGGHLAAAHTDYERASEFAGRAGAPLKVHTARLGLGETARLRGDLAEARRRFETVRSESTVRWGWAVDVLSRALIGLGWVAEAEGDAAEARSRHRQALELSLDRPHLPAAADAVEGLAGVALLEGAGERAALLLGAARALRGAAVADAPDVARVSARVRDLIGDAAYTGAYERGTAMTTEEALTLARP